MSPTIDDLRLTLQEMADESPAPAPSDLLAELTAQRRARRTRRGWGYAACAAAAAAVAVVAAQGLQPDPGAVDPGPASRGNDGQPHGWVLTDGAPPATVDGLTLLDSADLSGGGSVLVPDPEAVGQRQRYAVLWCEEGPASGDPAIQPPALVVDDPSVTVPCLPLSGGGAATPVALPPAGASGGLAARWEGDLPRDAEAVVAVYEEAPRTGYPYPPLPEPPLQAPAVPQDAVRLDTGTPLVDVTDTDGVRSRRMHVQTVSLGPDSRIELWAGAPGTLRVLVDGVWVTDDGDEEATVDWRTQDPELRDLGWQTFAPGRSRSLDLPATVLPPAGGSRLVEVAVEPVMGANPWQVAVTGVGEPPAAVEPSAVGLGMPDWYGGLRRVATWELPADGSVRELRVPDELEGAQAVWAVTCPDGDPATTGGSPRASVSVGGDPVDRGLSCFDVDQALVNLTLTRAIDDVLPTTSSPVLVSVEDGADGASTGTVSAYVPVSFEEFDFAAGTPFPQDGDPLDAIFPEGMEVESTVTMDDLVDGRATLTTTDRTMALRISSEGVGRVRVDGPAGLQQMGLPADGWWSSWTDQAVTQSLLGSLDHALSPGDELAFTVEGYEPGDLRIELLRVAGG